MSRRLALAVAVLSGSLLLAVSVAATGLVIVPNGEVVVVRRLGRMLPEPWSPGLHLGLPLGLDRRTRVRTDAVRQLEVGRSTAFVPGEDPGAGEYLTGDLNLLRARAVVQYRVADPLAFARNPDGFDRLLRWLAEASLGRALSRKAIDASLRDGRAAIAADVAADLSGRVARYRLGIAILGISLTDTRPPAEVAPDFAAAQAAQSDYDRRIHEARSYEATSLPAAAAAATAARERAGGDSDRAVTLAKGEAARFLSILPPAGPPRLLTIQRLYLDSLRTLLPRIKHKIVLAPEEPIDLSLFGLK